MTIIRESFLKKYFLNEVAKIYYLFVMWRHVCVCLIYSCCPVDVPAVGGVISVLRPRQEHQRGIQE